MQNSKIFKRCQKNTFKRKEYIFENGRKEYVQGYEPQALKILVKQYNTNDIIVDMKQINKIFYYTKDNKKHRYFPDIYIKSINTIIEVKSTWTYNGTKDKLTINQLKAKASINSGYLFEFWIMDRDGTIFEIIKY